MFAVNWNRVEALRGLGVHGSLFLVRRTPLKSKDGVEATG